MQGLETQNSAFTDLTLHTNLKKKIKSKDKKSIWVKIRFHTIVQLTQQLNCAHSALCSKFMMNLNCCDCRPDDQMYEGKISHQERHESQRS